MCPSIHCQRFHKRIQPKPHTDGAVIVERYRLDQVADETQGFVKRYPVLVAVQCKEEYPGVLPDALGLERRKLDQLFAKPPADEVDAHRQAGDFQCWGRAVCNAGVRSLLELQVDGVVAQGNVSENLAGAVV